MSEKFLFDTMFARSDIKIDTVKQIDRQKCYKKISQYPGILAKAVYYRNCTIGINLSK